jgi:hypothetical protein
MNPRFVSAQRIRQIARKYELPWPPPRDPDALKKAYREAMRKFHPDKGGGDEDAKHINEWLEVSQMLLEGKLQPRRRPSTPRRVVQQRRYAPFRYVRPVIQLQIPGLSQYTPDTNVLTFEFGGVVIKLTDE